MKQRDRAEGRASLLRAWVCDAFCLASVSWRSFSDTQFDVGVLLGEGVFGNSVN